MSEEENFTPKFHAKNGAKNGEFHAIFTLLGRGAEGAASWSAPAFPISKYRREKPKITKIHYISTLQILGHNVFSRFREGISFPNFVERSIPKLPLSKICSLYRTEHFRGGEQGKIGCTRRGSYSAKGRVSAF